MKIRNLLILLTGLLGLTACDFKLKPFSEMVGDTMQVTIQRYDRIESLYLTTGDFSALQQMSTDYPNETRTLIENVLGLGDVSDPQINSKLLRFYQDSTLQTVISDAEVQYANMSDLNTQLTDAFHTLKTWIPDIKVPMAYAQICAFDQSIVVGDESVGICLDKYLGADYPLYRKFYDEEQRKSMKRENIVPDFIFFYLLSLYHLPNFDTASQRELDLHVGKIQWVANKVMGNNFFRSKFVRVFDKYMQKQPDLPVKTLLEDFNYAKYKVED